jgi:polysaccharide biosynthesis transport protein
LPEKPDKPNRPAIVLLGLILALAGGIGSGALAESLDHSIRTPEQLARLTQLSQLAVIPFMPNEQDLSRAVKRQRLLKGAGVGALVMTLALLHLFVMPLDVLWFAALRRFGVG